MDYYLKTRACTYKHVLHEFHPTTRYLYLPRPNGKGGMTWSLAQPIGLQLEEAMTSAEIDPEMVCPLKTPSFPPGTHDYDPKIHSLIEGVSKCMITSEEAQAKFSAYRNAQGPHDEVYTDGSKINERVGAAAVINLHFQNGETTCCQLSKNSQIAVPSLLLRQQPSHWHWSIIGPWVLYSTMSLSTVTQCLTCRQLRAKILKTLLFARSWISFGHWTTKALVSASARCQAIVALRGTR